MYNNIRTPIAAGRFYPSTEKSLQDMLLSIDQRIKEKKINNCNDIIGGIVPHAGYIYSGIHAAAFFKEIENCDYDTLIIISPGHTGIGPALSIDSHTHWETPLGIIDADQSFIDAGIFEKDTTAQEFEHAAEVIIPFIQYYCKKVNSIAVITMRKQCYETALKVAQGIKQYTNTNSKSVFVIASSDFNHFESAEIGKNKDEKVINRIKSFDVEGVEIEIKRHNISVCGYGTIMALMLYAQQTSEKAEFVILSSGNSGEVADTKSVVDYVSAAFIKI